MQVSINRRCSSKKEGETRKEKRNGGNERKGKEKRKRERGRRPAVSSSIHWCSDGLNS